MPCKFKKQKKMAKKYDTKIEDLEDKLESLQADLNDSDSKDDYKVLVEKTKNTLKIRSKGKWYKVKLTDDVKIANTENIETPEEKEKRSERSDRALRETLSSLH